MSDWGGVASGGACARVTTAGTGVCGTLGFRAPIATCAAGGGAKMGARALVVAARGSAEAAGSEGVALEGERALSRGGVKPWVTESWVVLQHHWV